MAGRNSLIIRRLAVVLGVTMLAAACSVPTGDASPSPDPSPLGPSPSLPGSTTTPTSETEPTEPAGTELAATPGPTATRGPASTATPRPAKLTAAERWLVDALRRDARLNCVPRRSDLPRGALAAVECRIGSSLVDRVGVYMFEDQFRAARTHLARMESEGLLGVTGPCDAGRPGDEAWQGGDVTEDDESWQLVYKRTLYSTSRLGCFINAQGYANVRLTCSEHYIGVLGANRDVAGLTAWVRQWLDEGPFDAPGLCEGYFGGGLDEPDVEEDR